MTDEMKWRYDIESAKTLGRVMVAVDNDEKWVGWSHWLPDQERWANIGTNQTPSAWVSVRSPFEVAATLPEGLFCRTGCR